MNIETSILKELLSDRSYFNKVNPLLSEYNILSNTNKEIYNLIKSYYSKYNKTPNLVELAIQTREIPNKELRVQIGEELKNINSVVSTDKQFILDKTVEYIKDQVFTEAMMLGAEFIDKKDPKYRLKAKNLLENISKISIDQDTGLSYEDIESRIEYYQTIRKGIKYKRFNSLNKRLGDGFLPGTLNLFMAPAGVGKSLFISSSISDFIMQGYNVLLVSMEMSDFEFVKRIDADCLDLPINDLRNIPKEVILNKFRSQKFGKFYTKQYSPGQFSANNLESLLDMYKNQESLEFDIIFLDYLGIMKSDRVSPSVGLYSYIKSIAEEVRAVAVNRQIPIISASQLNRSAMNQKDAGNESVADSVGTVQTSDFQAFILQTDEMKEKSEVVVKITKNRYTGITDHWIQKIDYSKMRVCDVVEITSLQQNLEIEALINTEIESKTREVVDQEWNFE